MKISDIKEHIIISLFFSIPFSFITYLMTENILTLLIVFVLISFFIIITGLLTEQFGYKRHCEIIESEGFKRLISIGFEIEKVNDYVGISGVYRNYLFDVYYDWLTFSEYKNSKALVLNIHFEPPTINNETDHIRLRKISEKYIISHWGFVPRNYCFRWREGNVMMNNSIGLKNPNYEFITQKMDALIEILKVENLQPIGKTKLIEIRKTNENAQIPEILVYLSKKY